jgi:hypothetical protein
MKSALKHIRSLAGQQHLDNLAKLTVDCRQGDRVKVLKILVPAGGNRTDGSR